jgi:hypothetical protein
MFFLLSFGPRVHFRGKKLNSMHPMPLNPTSIVFSFLISHRAEIFFAASWALWATFKLIKRVIKIFEIMSMLIFFSIQFL